MRYLVVILTIITFAYSCLLKQGDYVCPPCDLPCDKLLFNQSGVCPHCQMKLVLKSSILDESTLVLNDVRLETGSGVFLMEGSKERLFKVYYHKPLQFNEQTKVLMVIPGAGRNGDSYRDAWVEESEKYNVLILSPMYDEDQYPFEDYHFCGLIKDVNLGEAFSLSTNSNQVHLKEEALSFSIQTNSDEWLFNDFDKVFDMVVSANGMIQTGYDIFGHSAGGQILHRMSIFQKTTKAKKIIAANSGFYTLPDFETPMPFGIKDCGLNEDDLKSSFKRELILLVGEKDNEYETGGTLLRSNTVDKQGLHRLARGRYFFQFSQNIAKVKNQDFNWTMMVVPGVGHNHRFMGDAAGRLLYEGK